MLEMYLYSRSEWLIHRRALRAPPPYGEDGKCHNLKAAIESLDEHSDKCRMRMQIASVSIYTTLKNGSAGSGKPPLMVFHIGTRYRVNRETFIDKNYGCWYCLCIFSCVIGCSPLPALKFSAVVNHDIYRRLIRERYQRF